VLFSHDVLRTPESCRLFDTRQLTALNARFVDAISPALRPENEELARGLHLFVLLHNFGIDRMKFLFTSASLALSTPAYGQQFEDPARLDREVTAITGAAIGQPGGAAHRIDPRLKLARCETGLQFETGAHGLLAVRCPGAGWRVRVPIMVLPDAAQAPENPMIKRGEIVTLRIAGSGFEVDIQAIALESGPVGKDIRVKTLTDQTTLLATVAKAGVAEISQ
jgi:flagellar basal body P-ring formation protein FlgA